MKEILLVGGAGGIGKAVCAYLAEKGCRVFSADIAQTHTAHKNVVPVHMDVRSMDSVCAAYEQVKQVCGGLDAVISLAGAYVMDSLIEVEEADIKRIMDINVFGVYRVNKVFLPLLKQGGRVIVTTSELEGLKPFPFNGMYSMSKTALGCYTDSLRLELQLLGIKVITVRPGAFHTKLVDGTHAQMRRMCEKTKLYKVGTKRFAQVMHSRTGNAKDPRLLAKVYHKAVTAKRPRLVYTKNTSRVIRLYAALPRRLEVWAIRMILKVK